MTVVTVKCDLGTDCADCGEWQPKGPVSWDTNTGKGPISVLMAKGVDVRVKDAHLPPVGDPPRAPFWFAFTDPKKDTDVSQHMAMGGVVEPSITKIFYQVFKEHCIRQKGKDGNKPALFVDVGANFGWFTAVAASMGCRVMAFEPVPHFRAFLEYTVALNGFGDLVDVRHEVVSHETGKELRLVVPSKGYWGTAGINGLNIDSNIPGAVLENVTAKSVTLGDAVNEEVLLLKVDVEGWEWSVFRGASTLFDRHPVHNIVMEYSPGVPERSFLHDDIINTVQMLIDLSNRKYKIAHLGEGKTGVTFDSPLGEFEEVTPVNLQYDLTDANALKDGKLGCPPIKELQWSCQSLPEDVSPRSLRSVIGHNTNLWLSKDDALMKLRGHIGMIKLDEPSSTFTITAHPGWGMGMRWCNGIEPVYQVRHRCKCSNKDVCGEQEQQAIKLAKEGKLPQNYVLTPS